MIIIIIIMCEQRRPRVPSPTLDLSKSQLRRFVHRRRWKVRFSLSLNHRNYVAILVIITAVLFVVIVNYVVRFRCRAY